MKRVAVFIFALLSLVPVAAQAQRTMPFGAKVALNMSTVHGDDVSEYVEAGGEVERVPGVAIGAFTAFQLSSIIYLEPELLYSMQGFILRPAVGSYETRLHYLQVPVLLKLTSERGGLRPAFLVGPAFSFLLASSSEFRLANTRTETDTTSSTKRVDAGLAIGLGLDLDSGRHHLHFEGRYTMGFISIDEDESGDVRNGVLSFFLGYEI